MRRKLKNTWLGLDGTLQVSENQTYKNSRLDNNNTAMIATTMPPQPPQPMFNPIDSDFLEAVLEDCGFYELCGLLESEVDEETIYPGPDVACTYSAEEIYDIPLCSTSPDWFSSYWQQYDRDE